LQTPTKEGGRTVVFQKTPRMSTYLLAFVIGEFDYVEGMGKVNSGTDKQIPYRVYTPVNLQDRGSFALDVARQVTPYFGKYFIYDYKLPHL
jgi:puromycin-sensitive aminopeptidase